MAGKAIPSLVRETITAITPDYRRLTKTLLIPAKVFWFASMVGRKIRVFSNPKNRFPLLAGTILDAAVGKNPTVAKAARIVCGAAAIVKCSEKMLHIVNLAGSIGRIFRGKEFPLIKQKSWNNLLVSKTKSPSQAYNEKLKKIRTPYLVKMLFALILEIIKSVGLLFLYFTDAITSFRDNNSTSEIFVHSIDLFNKLTSTDSEIVKHLKKLENVTDMMLKGIGASWATTALLGLFILPAKIRQQVPGIDDLFDNFKANFSFIKDKIDGARELVFKSYLDALNKAQITKRVPKSLIPEIEREFDFFDPEKVRFIDPIFRY